MIPMNGLKVTVGKENGIEAVSMKNGMIGENKGLRV